ncbi:MAG: hypothetical protein J1F65_00845 [Clostridiales bacterium]|nr:hypothetical protein [Clostridiales bacterium]
MLQKESNENITSIVDRELQKAKINERIRESVTTDAILIVNENGSGASYFVKTVCGKENIFYIKSDYTGKFVQSLFKATFAWDKVGFFNFVKLREIENEKCELIDTNINFTDNDRLLIEKFINLFNNQTTLTYRSALDKRYHMNLESIVIDYLKQLPTRYIVYNHFETGSECEMVNSFIQQVDNKIHIIVANSCEYYQNFEAEKIEIYNFNKNEKNYFKELLKRLVPIISETVLSTLAEELYDIYKGSPENLVELINNCRDEIHNCTEDEEIAEAIRDKYNSRNNIIEKIINKQILSVLYLSRTPLEYKFVANLICSQYGISQVRFEEHLSELTSCGYVEINFNDLFISKQSNNYFTLNVVSTREESIKLCYQVLSLINRCDNVDKQTNADAIKLISNILLDLKHSGIEFDGIYYEQVKRYADFLRNSHDLCTASEYYALCSDKINNIPYCEILDIAKILYNYGYYTECYKLLVGNSFDMLSNEIQFERFLLIANCETVGNNNIAIQYYEKAINLHTKKQLIAIGGKFLAQGESKIANRTILNQEYEKCVAKYEDKPDTIGYVALLRNALDFQNNETAIQTMQRGLELAKTQCLQEEIYKIQQNLALNYIKAGQYDYAEKLLQMVLAYCEKKVRKDTSYPLINLAVVNLYKYFNCQNYEYALNAMEYGRKAISYACSYYSRTLSNLQYLTALSVLSSCENNPYNISHNRIVSLREKIYEDIIKNNNRNDFRVVVRTYLSLIASANICGDFEAAKIYLRELYSRQYNEIGREACKVNLLIRQLQMDDLEPMLEPTIDKSCENYHKEIRFEPWMISLTHY